MTWARGRQNKLKKGQATGKEQYLTERQIVPMLYDQYRVSEKGGAVLEIQDLLNDEMKGGDLRAFLNDGN